MPLNPDEPVRTLAEDKLGRAPFARALASSILRAPRQAGFVVGLAGAWGSGKTSIINFAREVIEQQRDSQGKPRYTILDFNPWIFSGTEQLVARFFIEIGIQLRGTKGRNLAKIGERMTAYGNVLSKLSFIPVAGAVAEIAGSAISATGEAVSKSNSEKSLEKQRDELRAQLEDAVTSIVIIIDDIDRLDDKEIKDIMRLVKLTGNFPNLIYVLSFERRRVEQALGMGYGGAAVDGRAYLEKIVQVSYDVPHVNQARLSMVLADGINQVFNSIDFELRTSELQLVFDTIISRLCKDIRAVRRFCNSLPMAIESIGDEINLIDTLALEAIRVMVPEVFAALPEFITTVQSSTSGTGRPRQLAIDDAKRQGEEILVSAGSHREVVLDVLHHVFPATDQFFRPGQGTYHVSSYAYWRRHRRVAHPEVFRFYLERTLGEDDVSARQVGELFTALKDGSRLRELLGQLDVSLLRGALRRLESYESEFPAEGTEEAIAALMDQVPRIYERYPIRMMEDPALGPERVVLRLLRHVTPQRRRSKLVKDSFEAIESVFGKCEFADLVGYRANSGHRLVTSADAEVLARRARDAVVALSPTDLAAEPSVAHLLDWVVYVGGEEGRDWNTRKIGEVPVVLALIRSARSTRYSSDSTSGTERETVLAWDWLCNMVHEDVLVTSVKALPATAMLQESDDDTREAVRLASRYADGWRPIDAFTGVRGTDGDEDFDELDAVVREGGVRADEESNPAGQPPPVDT